MLLMRLLTILNNITNMLTAYVLLLWMEEILHQIVYGLSHCNPIIYSVL